MSTHSHRRHVSTLCVLLAVLVPAHAQEPRSGALDLSVSYVGDLRRNTTGGLEVGTAYADAFDLGVNWNTEAFGTPLTARFAVMYMGGDAISGDFVGDLQGLNNIEAPPGWRLYESWVEFHFGETAGTLRAGVLDLNAEFDTPVTQGLFTGSPFGVGTELSQTGERGPAIWPFTGLGIRAAGELSDGLTWRFGVYDGAPGSENDSFTSMKLSSDEGALLIGELEYSSERFHKISFGSWAYTAAFEPIDAAMQPDAAHSHGNHGFYATIDLALGVIGDVGFDAALRAGTAPETFNVVDRYAGAAITTSNFWPARPGDTLGLGIAWAHAGSPFRDLSEFEGHPAASAETLIELVYRAEITPWLSLLPVVQFVNNPGAMSAVDDSWVAGLRFELSREHSWHLDARRAPSDDGSLARRQP